jgi:hypothetical protein
MITFFGTLLRIVFHAFRSKRNILSENALLKKENDILLRRVGKKRVHFNIRQMERLFRTVRREALDNFLLAGKNQVQRILDEFVAFYNSQRPHQGIQQQIPKHGEPEKTGGVVRKSAVLGGLHHHYYRPAA